MGDPRKHRKKYSTPKHPWMMERIVEEKALKKEYGIRNNKEIWKLKSTLNSFAAQAKKLVIAKGAQADKEKENLLNRLVNLGLMAPGSTSLDEILAIDLKAIMERRLETLVVRKGFAKTMNQARQFIVHGHIMADGKEIRSPNHLVLKSEEDKVVFVPTSSLSDPEHPERQMRQKPEEVEVLAKKKDAEKAREQKSAAKKEEPKPEKKPEHKEKKGKKAEEKKQ